MNFTDTPEYLNILLFQYLTAGCSQRVCCYRVSTSQQRVPLVGVVVGRVRESGVIPTFSDMELSTVLN
jgi:hypothetical protein